MQKLYVLGYFLLAKSNHPVSHVLIVYGNPHKELIHHSLSRPHIYTINGAFLENVQCAGAKVSKHMTQYGRSMYRNYVPGKFPAFSLIQLPGHLCPNCLYIDIHIRNLSKSPDCICLNYLMEKST